MTLRAHFFTGEDREAVLDLQRFRKRLFIDQCGWDLPVQDGLERDAFDRTDTVHLVVSDDAAPRSTFRAIRSDRPYLGRCVFPELAMFDGYPERADAWEISRFGVLDAPDAQHLALVNYALMFSFARRVQASALIAVADLTYERFLRGLRVRTRRYGPPQIVGADRAGRPLQLVAGEIPLSMQAPSRLAAFATHLAGVEIHDEHVFGPTRVSA